VRQFPNAQFKDVVRPNVDTLYTTAFISMKEGPWVFEMPANDKRYELMPFMDAWTNVFASPGTRTSGCLLHLAPELQAIKAPLIYWPAQNGMARCPRA
ncbi:MAG: hypothetical protein RL298_997, partial [Pseudomonadota bacterium]